MLRLCLTGCFLSLFVTTSALTGSNVLIGIDFGSEFIKVAVFKPGRQIEVALNSEARRKMPTLVAFRNGERLIGEPAMSMATKHPDMAFHHTPLLLGRHLNCPIVKIYQRRYPHHQLVTGVDGTLEFLLQGDERLSVEQLTAMLLEAALETAESFLAGSADISFAKNSSISAADEVVITTPPFWGQSERQALLRAAQYAGISTARLINSNAAVALNFGSNIISSLGSKPQWHNFFDMGASSTVATAASYQKVPGTRHPQLCLLRIHGVGYDAALGAVDFINRLIPVDPNVASQVPKDAISLAKTRAAAGQLFRVLSANRRSGLMTRDRFHSLVADLLERLRRPVEMMTSLANATSDVLLMGGGSRCPLVQEELMKITGRSRLGHSINTDEAAALGAVQHLVVMRENRDRILGKEPVGRGGFARRKLGGALTLLVDVNLFPVAVYSDITSSSLRRQSVFSLGDPIPHKKTINLEVNAAPSTAEFYIALEYQNLTHLSEFQRSSLGGPLLVKYRTSGFRQILEKSSNVSTQSRHKIIEALFRLDSSGLVWLDKLELIAVEANNNGTGMVRQMIQFQPTEFGYPVPSFEQRQHARAVVQKFRRRELEARAAAKSRNDLEAAVIEARARLVADSNSGSHSNRPTATNTDSPIYARCSNAKERHVLFSALANAERLLVAGSSSNGTQLDTELNRLNQAFAAVSTRAAELTKRPAALASLDAVLKLATAKASGMEDNSELTEAIRSIQIWLTTAQAALTRADLTQDPPILVRQIDEQKAALEKLMANLEKKKISSDKNLENGKLRDSTGRLDDEMEDNDDERPSESISRKPLLPTEDEAEYRDEDGAREDDRNGDPIDFQSPYGEL